MASECIGGRDCGLYDSVAVVRTVEWGFSGFGGRGVFDVQEVGGMGDGREMGGGRRKGKRKEIGGGMGEGAGKNGWGEEGAGRRKGGCMGSW